MDIVTRPWRHYADFEGRSSRTEYFLFSIVLYAVLGGLLLMTGALGGLRSGGAATFTLVLMVGVLLAGIIPAWAVTVRRLHDQGKSGWMILLSFIPFIGWVFALIFAFWPGDDFDNEYGPNPRLGYADQGVSEVFS
jgi:uncharacterized membrane protein YhaH (DUF805 family)